MPMAYGHTYPFPWPMTAPLHFHGLVFMVLAQMDERITTRGVGI
jgi:hypothetical protein